MAERDLTLAAAPPSQEQPGLLAPGWHTIAVLVFLFGVAALSAWRGAASPVGEVSSYARIANYGTVFVWEWLMVAFIAWGVRRRGHSLSDLIAGRWATAGAFWRDLGISVLFLMCSTVVLGIIRSALRDKPNRAVINLLPDTLLEMAAWVVLAATAGFCEETIFRGYLQKQFARLTRNTGLGIALQALVFGACHGYQGVKSTVSIAVFGLMFGLLANYRQTLRPGMLAHFLQDGMAGLVGRTALKHFNAG